MHKSEAMMQLCLANEWKAQVKPSNLGGDPSEINYNLYALRNNETLHVVYQGNKLIGASYVFGETKLKLNWKNQVVKLITGKPDLRRLRNSNTDLEETRYVPFDADTPDDKVIAELSGCEIAYIRSIDRELMTARIPIHLHTKHIRVSRVKSDETKRILEWADAFGFHAVHLDSIVQVS